MGQRSVVMEKSVHRSNNCDVRPKPSDTSNVGEKGSLIVNNDGIFVNASVNGVNVKFLIDSGSRPTILSSRMYEKLNSKPCLYRSTGLKLADGRPLSQAGVGKFKLELGVIDVEHDVWVADIQEEGLLGYDFLHKYNCDLKLSTNKLTVHTPSLLKDQKPTDPDDISEQACCRVAVAETSIIPANSESLIQARLLTKPKLQAKVGVIEPREVFLEKHELMVAKVLVDPQHDVIPLRVLNATSKPITVHKNTIAATCHEVKGIVKQTDSRYERCRNVTEVESQGDGEEIVPKHLKDLWQRSCQDLTDRQKRRVASLLAKYGDVFAKSPDDLGLTDMIEYEISLAKSEAINQRARRKPMHMRAEEERHIKDLLKRGLIEPSNSPLASPTVLVVKKDGTTRFCVDYRKVNECSIKNSYPLPLISDSLDSLDGAKWFCTLDMASGYWQVPVAESSRPITAFVSETSGHFQWRVLPFGLCNAPSCFEALMEKVLAGLQWKTCLLYLDDIICHGSTFDQAMSRLEEVLERLRAANLKLGPNKCHLFQTSVTYLGHKVSKDGIATDPAKVEAVKDWPTPENVSDVRSWIGFTSYFRRFISGYSEIQKPLYALTEKTDTTFNWTPKCEEAFKQMKKALTEAPVLAYPSRESTFILDCDASNYGMGAVLSQEDGDGIERPVAYFSKTLKKPERRYCVTRKELLALVSAVRHFHHYLYGRKFLIRTDHGALRWLMNFKNPKGQTARWIEVLGTYDYEIRHRPGRLHQNADGLSRRPCVECRQCEIIEINNDEERPIHVRRKTRKLCKKHELEEDTDFNLSIGENLLPPIESDETKQDTLVAHITRHKENNPGDKNDQIQDKHDSDNQNVLDNDPNKSWINQWPAERLRRLQMEDPELVHILTWKEAGERPKWQDIAHLSPSEKTYWSHWDQLHVINGVLYKRWVSEWGDRVIWKLVVPKSLRSMVFDNLHKHRTAGHFGENKTIDRVGERYWWVSWRAFVRSSCKKCDSCAAKKPPRRTPRAPMKTYNVGAPLERVGIDVMGPLPESERGNKYILVVGDYFTKWMEAYAIPNQETPTIAKVLAEEFICRYGVPRIIQSDQGRNFESHIFTVLCKILDIDKSRSSALHPQTNGMVERQNRVIQHVLSMFVSKNQRDWDQHLPYMMMAYRSAVHESLKCSPCEMMLGRNVELPIDILLGVPPDAENDNPERPATAYAQELQERLKLVHDYARQNIKIASETQKKNYDHRCDGRPLFERGEAVWLHNPQRKKGVCPKLSCTWEGPYLVIERLCDVVYKIQKTSKSTPKVVHSNRLKKYWGDNAPASWLVTPVNHSQLDSVKVTQTSRTEKRDVGVQVQVGLDSGDIPNHANMPPTGISNDQPVSVENDQEGQRKVQENSTSDSTAPELSDDEEYMNMPEISLTNNGDNEMNETPIPISSEPFEKVETPKKSGLRRSKRVRKTPEKYKDFVLKLETIPEFNE